MANKTPEVEDLVIESVEGAMDQGATGDFVALSTAYIRLRDQLKQLKTSHTRMRNDLLKIVGEFGYDDGGSQALDLPKAVSGVNRLVRQRRATKNLEVSVAEGILRSKGLWDRCTVPVRVIDSDSVMAALYEGTLTEEDISAIFPEKVTYALVTK